MMTQVHTYPLTPNPFLRPSHGTSSRQRQLHSLRPPESPMQRKSREKKGTFLGIEVAESLHWHGWELGTEVTKHLTLKNVQLKTKKLKYSPPSTTFFSTLFPQPIVLSAGTSFSLPVTFHPLEKREYEDCIRFETSDGHFSIVLRATLPRHGLLIPGSLHLPMCAVQDSSEGSFVIRNVSELRTCFKWEVPEPFLVIPTSGLLEPGAHGSVKVIFTPRAALVYDVTATCRFGDGEEHEKSIQLTSVAKYPHLVVRASGEAEDKAVPEEAELHFGPVAVGCTAERHIEVRNLSSVNASFHVEREKPSSPLDCAFFCSATHGVVPAHGALKIPLSFRPQTAGAESVDYFSVVPAGNITKAVLKVTGSCRGPSVSLQSPFVHFGLIDLGQQALRTVEICNESSAMAHYQFDIDAKESVFSFDRTCGVLAGNTKQILNITFCPTHPIAHHRRVACLVHHQDPLFLDLIGTCHSDEVKPAVLLPKHLSLYRTNMARGLTFYPPDILGAMLKEGKLQMDTDGALLLPPQDPTSSAPVTYPHIHSMSEFFEDGFSSDLAIFPPHVTANIRDFNFGRCLVGQEADPLPISLTNHTKGKVTIIWTCSTESPFRVTPESTEIPPLKSTAFRLSFLPSQANTVYGSELEAFASYKVLRNYRNVEDATLCPPWCLTIRAQGHTFEPGHEHFIPNCVLDSPKVLFPAVSQGSMSHRSILLQNTGTSPLTFSLDQTSCPSVLVKPSCGYVPPSAHHVLLLRTSPEGTMTKKQLLPLQLNSCQNYTQEILLVSRAETPLLLLEGDGQLFFQPTCVGTPSNRSYTLKNTSRLLLHYEWKVQHSDSKFLSVSPASGVILPNETSSQTWVFVPWEEIKYFAKASVYVWGAQQGLEPEKKARYTLRVIGEGATGAIVAEQEQLHLGNILVGGFQSHDLVLLNNGNCGLTYVLSVEQAITGPCDPEEVLSDPVALELEQYKGMIPARTKLVLKITARPARRAQYSWTISYSVLAPEASDPASTVSERQLLCQAMAQGIYPSFSISDALPEGSAGSITKMQLWRLFSLDTLNAYLERDPTPAELVYRVPTRHSTRRCPSSYTPVMLDFNFGAAPLGSDPFVALLMLENRGQVPVDWAFLYPTDQQIELEYWAETGEFDPSELHQMRIQENKLFSIAPKLGTLTPGQQQSVQLMYRHDFIGTDRLPVLLKVSYGREVLLNFIGVTVEKEHRYVHFTATKHQFTPVAIGTSSPPKQIYELFNGGSLPVIYEIQLDRLREIQEQNFQHPVFQCLNPRGEILPGMTAHVEWIFSPLEAKTYAVDIPVHILGGDSALITFQGIGYDQHALGRTGRFDDSSTSCGWSPGTRRLTIPGQAALLSEQKVVFGDIPVYSKSSRLVFLNNTSESESIFYSWYAASPIVSEALQVSPQTGVVQPGEGAPCVITLLDYGQAAFYSMDLVCEVFLQRDLTVYERELLLWEEEKERQAVEFTITEQDTIAEKKLKQQSRCSMDLAGTRNSSDAASAIRKYKTLPPIKHGTPCRSPASRNPERDRMEREARRLWARPEPPSPVQLHLGVTARSHHIEDFMTHFSSDLAKHFIYRRPKEKTAQPLVGLQPETGETEKDPSKPSAQEALLAADIMTMVIRNLLDDVHFHDALTQGLAEPLPYFTQLSSKDSVKASGSPASLVDSTAETPTPMHTDIEEEEEEEGWMQEEGQGLEEDQVEEADPRALGLIRRTQGPLATGAKEAPEKRIHDLLLLNKGQELQEKIKRALCHNRENDSQAHLKKGGEEPRRSQGVKETSSARQLGQKQHPGRNACRRLPAVSILMESILENTLQNILIEANRGEVVLTARPRVIALPPVTPR